MTRPKSDWTSQMRRGLLEFCILSILEEEPGYGYEIVTRLAVAPSLAAPEGTVYPLLRRLKAQGWLTTFWRESESGPPRQYYELAAVGAERLKDLRGEWRELTTAVDRLTDAAGREREEAV